MNDPAKPTDADPLQAELVAYLDGELDHVEAQRVEQRLSTDPQYRRRLQQLQRAWDLLDQLPRVEAPANFTSTTVEMVAVKASAEAQQSVGGLRRRRWGLWAFQAVSVAVAVLVGYLYVQERQNAPERRFLTDLPVIENVELYLNADDLSFLRELKQRQLFERESPDAPSTAAELDTKNLSERRQWVAQRDSDEREELLRKREVFDKLSAERQEHLRQFHAHLTADAEASELRDTLQPYSDWLRTLPAGRRAELVSLPGDERLGQVQQLLDQQRREREQRMPKPGGRTLQGEDAKVLAQWMGEYVGRHEEELLKLVAPGMWRDRMRQNADPERRRAGLFFILARARAEGNAQEILPSDDDYLSLAEKLSAKPGQELKNAAGRKERADLVFEWTRNQFMSLFQPPQPSREDLERFFHDEISANDRAWLEGLTPERFARELRRLYQVQQMRRAFETQRGPNAKPGGPPGTPRPGPNGKPDDRPSGEL